MQGRAAFGVWGSVKGKGRESLVWNVEGPPPPPTRTGDQVVRSDEKEVGTTGVRAWCRSQTRIPARLPCSRVTLKKPVDLGISVSTVRWSWVLHQAVRVKRGNSTAGLGSLQQTLASFKI